MKLVVLALIPLSLSIHVRDSATKPATKPADFKSLSPSERKAELKAYYADVSKHMSEYLKERTLPGCECQKQEPVQGFTQQMFEGEWYMAFHHPTIFEMGFRTKCGKVEFTEEAGLQNDYDFKMFAQVQLVMDLGLETSTVELCGERADENSAARTKIGMCDEPTEDVNFIVIHHDDGVSGGSCGREFFVSVGTDPSIPIYDETLDPENCKCIHPQITAEQMGGLFVYTKTSEPLDGDCLQRAKDVISEKGMIWEGIMQETPQDDCEYEDRPSSLVAQDVVKPLEEAAQSVQDGVEQILEPKTLKDEK